MPSTYHPSSDNKGRQVLIRRPHLPSSAAAWGHAQATARCVPGQSPDVELNGVLMAPWLRPPESDDAWEALAAGEPLQEPAFNCPAGLQPAAGAIVLEPDGRIWCVAPTNGFGGHEFTLPKGRADGRGLRATALIEVFEETGLQIRLLSFLCDVRRTLTYTRFYLAERLGGCPGLAGWETQAVVLAPRAALSALLTHPGDTLVLASLDGLSAPG
ncbi:NUDIX hydrolase [Variovorax saccharolyticus]|uniref:NUDIX hydrolase n=1 Tax=Variovorax saccharolyticus TaxID=3053516 RepID=UPI00257582F4|nr:NUDIX hydrolase [Variovorax sp. J31P216]MDM0029597.1 NUDIX hydrolase [Variovorax sp. J31P216]